jgi:hypothetical protein
VKPGEIHRIKTKIYLPTIRDWVVSALRGCSLVGEAASNPNMTFSGTTAIAQDGSGIVDSGNENFVTNGTVILVIGGDGVDQPFLYVGRKQ